jgi:hypothetical protein
MSIEAMRMSVEAVRVSIEALRCFKGRERLEEVPENVNWGHESPAHEKKPGDMEMGFKPIRYVISGKGT